MIVSDESKMNKEIKETEDLIDKNFDQARALADRRDFFTLSLVFTILALAIQTAEFGKHEFQKFLEALSQVLRLCYVFGCHQDIISSKGMKRDIE